MTDRRIKQAFSLLKKNKIDCLLVTEINHVRYLSGFTGSNGMVILAPPKAYFLTDFRYLVQAQKEVKDCTVIIADRELTSELPKLPVFSRKIRVGVEAAFVSLKLQGQLKDLLSKADFKPTENLIESLAVAKDTEEIRRIKKAVRIADQAFAETLKYLKPGAKEKDIALELEYKMRSHGADGAAFDIIVASGQRSSMPHGKASGKKLRKGDFVTIDFGAVYQGYTSDITRTVVLGKATGRQKKIYDIVLTAQKKACKAARPGLACSRLDGVAREIIMKSGFGDNFGHGLGHGIGMIVHDHPTLNPRSTDTLREGMVVTIEPGIYIPNWGGVRIEDNVLITASGGQVLSKSPKELLEL
jgi:Xaa-Pro aminopeptidase